MESPCGALSSAPSHIRLRLRKWSGFCFTSSLWRTLLFCPSLDWKRWPDNQPAETPAGADSAAGPEGRGGNKAACPLASTRRGPWRAAAPGLCRGCGEHPQFSPDAFAEGVSTQTRIEITAWWLSGKESTWRCRRRGLDPWVRKIPWRRK